MYKIYFVQYSYCMPVRNIIGALALGNDFFDRHREISQFWNDLETDNLLLLAPRRVGKTSILRRMEETATDHDFQAIFLDVSDCADEQAFVRRLYGAVLETKLGDKLWERIKGSALGQTIGRVSKAGGAGFSIEFKSEANDWARMGEELADALQRLDGRWLIQIDELPVFVLKLLGQPAAQQVARIREFLYWLRRLRLTFPNVRWMLTGSIGLDTVTARLNVSDAINDLRIVTVGAFSESTAHAFLTALAEAYHLDLPEDRRQRALTRIGWLAPYYIQLVFKQLRDQPEADVDTAIDTLLRPEYKGHFDYWRQRLELELGQPDAGQAGGLLNACARDPEGATIATLSQVLSAAIADPSLRQPHLRYLLDVLVTDGYLVEHELRYRFRFALLREYWLRRILPWEGV